MSDLIRRPFFVITFDDHCGAQQASCVFDTIELARKLKTVFEKFGLNVRIMQGGAGGMEVS